MNRSKFSKLTAFLLVLFAFTQVKAQELDPENYGRTHIMGASLHSLGWGFFYENQWNNSLRSNPMIHLEFLRIRHPKEVRSYNENFQDGADFVLGKENSLFSLRAGYGNQMVLANRRDKSNLGLSFKYSGGLSLGILKPVYLDVIYQQGAQPNEFYIKHERYNSENPNHNNPALIFGQSSFDYGMGSLRFVPGAYAKGGISFDWGYFSDEVKSVEFGLALDAFPKKMPLMAFTKNRAIFTTFYVALTFGSKN